MKQREDVSQHKTYKQGFAFGMCPAFAEFEDLQQCRNAFDNENFKSGFLAGRQQFEYLNGPVADGLPDQILSVQHLQEFKILGQLDIPYSSESYSIHQRRIIRHQYEEGQKSYCANAGFKLYSLLTEAGLGLDH